jgi:putative transcriptional regulator
MANDDFEWDEAKAAANYARHSVSFETAIRAFDDAFAVERLDDRADYGEDRYSILGMVDGRLLYVATRCARTSYASFRRVEQNHMKSGNTTRITRKQAKSSKTDWIRFDAMTAAEKHAAALSDPDARPLTEEDMRRMKRTPRAKIIRRALGLSQEDFAARYHIPVGTLRDWEQGRVEPDQAARAYLTVIARDPDAVHKALNSLPTRSSR